LSDNRRRKGARGEETAAQYLTAKGWRIIERNWRCRSGEVDIIAETDGTLIFIEVRSRTGDTHGTAAESVTARKIAQVRHIAEIYLHMRGTTDTPVRFDMIAVRLLPDQKAEIMEHIEAAF
jgi:putative endonuclease